MIFGTFYLFSREKDEKKMKLFSLVCKIVVTSSKVDQFRRFLGQNWCKFREKFNQAIGSTIAWLENINFLVLSLEKLIKGGLSEGFSMKMNFNTN